MTAFRYAIPRSVQTDPHKSALQANSCGERNCVLTDNLNSTVLHTVLQVVKKMKITTKENRKKKRNLRLGAASFPQTR